MLYVMLIQSSSLNDLKKFYIDFKSAVKIAEMICNLRLPIVRVY